MCDLNSIELVWAKVKNYIRNAITAGNLTVKKQGVDRGCIQD
jgi:transposase